MSIIQLLNVSKSYGNKEVLNDISIDIKEGEFIAITGKSGAGKSTILNIIGLLETADSGNVIIDNTKNIKPNSAKSTVILRNKISYLFQNFALIEEETVAYNLLLAVKYVKGNKGFKLQKIKEALGKVGLEGYENRKVFELSGGEQQRVAVARIIIKPSKIVLADEPTGSLDENNKNIVLNLLNILNKEGKTVVIVTHDKQVSQNCNRVIEL